RLLIVDDHDDTRQILVRLLKSTYSVSVAHCYDSAMAQAAQSTPDVVVSDIGLPGRDGLELMRELRRRYGVPGVAVTGHPPDPQTLREAGFVAYLLKPIIFQQLLDAVEHACAQRERRPRSDRVELAS